ncbi:Murein DD-endopeptidase MepM [Hydrogenovibrio crunogenus]|uniref:Murein DD-endopeptidase MepM n=1 Tax=Hydrogenovibrio crunogenus TaxID=39765 RepID=A0A4P7NZ67_9GAMM|nr:M23 family metallopeptidase [Hydrogenovibrio crunogenus]QBZ82825.1 Murein DD-endopeptidase MepM [Hydrogenovibrio crunogenus]RUM91119.1 MAG: M23 family peptidase [Thiomicrospira sp.]
MKNHFTITISDVHGSRHFSFKQFMRKFALFVVMFIFLMLAGAAGVIWWLNQEIIDIQDKRQVAEASYQAVLEKSKHSYMTLEAEKRKLQSQLDNKSKQIQFLDQTLQGLEDLIGVKPDEDELLTDRVKIVQLTTLEKQIMLEDIPSGRPVKKYQGVSSSFGWRIHPVKGTKEFHRGIDYRGKRGDGVIATASGTIEYAGYHKRSGYGRLIIISHDNGFKTLYGHMSKLHVKTGQVVKKGELIGEIGSSGLSSGPHLHYEVSFVQRKLNPVPFINWDLKHYDEIFKKVKGVPWGSLSQVVQNRVQQVEKQLLLRDVK